MSRTGISAALSAVLLILLVAMTGCGKKGALYLPDQSQPAKKTQQSPETPPPATPTQTP